MCKLKVSYGHHATKEARKVHDWSRQKNRKFSISLQSAVHTNIDFIDNIKAHLNCKCKNITTMINDIVLAFLHRLFNKIRIHQNNKSIFVHLVTYRLDLKEWSRLCAYTRKSKQRIHYLIDQRLYYYTIIYNFLIQVSSFGLLTK